MTDRTASAFEPSAFDEIEAALGATARGRAFLAEFARRARQADTGTVLDAIAKLERRLGNPISGDILEELRVRRDAASRHLREARSHFADRAPLGQVSAVDLVSAEPVMPTIFAAAGAEVGDAGEAVQDIAWTLREAGFDQRLCDRLDAVAADVQRVANRLERLEPGEPTLDAVFGEIAKAEDAIRRIGSLTGDTIKAPPPWLLDGTGSVLASADLDFVAAQPPSAAESGKG